MSFKVGDTVRILRQDIFHLKGVQGDDRIGKIVGVDGAYIYVRPKNKRWEIELYAGEIELFKKETA